MSLTQRVKSLFKGGSGPAKETKYEQWSSPAPWRSDDCVYIGANGQAWMFRTLDLSPVKWEDNEARLAIGKQLENLLAEIGQLSKEPVGGIRALSNNREIHIQSITWQEVLTAPEGNPPPLADYQQDVYGVTVPRRALFLGVKLRPQIMSRKEGSGSSQSIYRTVEEIIKQSIAEDVPRLDIVKDDAERLDRIFSRHDAKVPTRAEIAQLESWFNNGMGQDVLIDELSDHLIVDGGVPIQFAAAREFDVAQLTSPNDQWIMDALSHPGDAPHVVSIRAELEPTSVTSGRARMSQRKIQANIKEEEDAGDLERPEDSETFKLVQEFESYLASETRPMLTNVSLLMCRELSDESETYMDFLEKGYGLHMTVLEHRQMLALDETLPASDVRVCPFLQDLNVPMVAYAGLQAFSALGDDRGVFTGFIDPDGAPLFIDPLASSRQNLPPAFGVFGDPGSGKSSPVDTPVFTPEGVTTMGALRPGSRVFGQDGQPTKVTAIHPQGILDTYEVTIADGRTLDTSDTHIWHVLDREDEDAGWQNLQLKDIRDHLFLDDGSPRYMVPLSRPLEWEEQELPVDPYVVGAFAAAGPEAGPYLGDASVVDEVLLYQLEDGALIPEEYLLGSVDQRERLLAGFIDFAGGPTPDAPTATLVRSLSPDQAEQVARLTRSLGGVALEVENLGSLVDLLVEVPEDIYPHEGDLYQYTLPIVAVERNGSDEHVCITVEAADSLYVSGDFVVSHNTFFAQNFATQSVLYGMPVFFINPKASDPLLGLCDYINDNTPATASTTSIGAAMEEPGAFDPFRFANDPGYAAEVAGAHILAALDIPQDPLPRELRLSLQQGLKRGAEAGAACVWDALDFIPNLEHRDVLKNLVEQQMDASGLFALGIAKRPRGRLNMLSNHLTLVNFDREIGLPAKTDESQYSIAERIALATVSLITKAALEILIANRGGVLVLDEAWTFLSQPEALAALSRISREGRSLNIVPVFLTQRIKDVISRDLEGFMSRVMVLKLNEAEEAREAIRICGLKATDQRLALLRSAGPKPADPEAGRPAVWAQGLFRDLHFRHSWVALGPTPEDAMRAWSTSPEDRQRYAEERRAEMDREHEEAALSAGLDVEELEKQIEDLQAPAPPADTGGSGDRDVPAPEPREAVEEAGDEAPARPVNPFTQPVPPWQGQATPDEPSPPAAPTSAPTPVVEPEQQPAEAHNPFAKPVAPWERTAEPDVEESSPSVPLFSKPAE